MDKAVLIRELATIVGDGHVLSDDYDLRLYQFDGSIDKATPEAVVFPASTREVSEIVRLCNRYHLPFTARGAGTGLSGGCIPAEGGIQIGFARMNRILEIDLENLRAIVEPGVVNIHLSWAVAPYNLYYVPDPSSQKACTLGGNVAENSGGPHTLLYGVTANHVLGLEVVMPDGEVLQLGGKTQDPVGYDLVGLLVGSEGTLCLVTKIIVRLVPIAPGVKTLLAIFNHVDDASTAVSTIISRGIVPAALEMMDGIVMRAIEAARPCGFPLDAEAALIVEVEGLPEGTVEMASRIEKICHECGAREVREAKTTKERERLWAGRKGAFGALGRISPDYYTMDGVVPRTRIPAVLAKIAEVSDRTGLTICNVFHAGDGNLHPLILFDSDREGDLEKVHQAGGEILRICAEEGGSLTGEHGIGMEKRDYLPLIFSAEDIAIMERLKKALDPSGLANPGKIFPTPGRCIQPSRRRPVAVGW